MIQSIDSKYMVFIPFVLGILYTYKKNNLYLYLLLLPSFMKLIWRVCWRRTHGVINLKSIQVRTLKMYNFCMRFALYWILYYAWIIWFAHPISISRQNHSTRWCNVKNGNALSLFLRKLSRVGIWIAESENELTKKSWNAMLILMPVA